MGGAFLGLAMGSAVMMQFPDVEPTMIPLVVAAAVMGAASLSVSSNSEGIPGMVARTVLGKPFQTLGLSLQKAIDDSIASMVVDAQYKLETVTDQLKALPSLTAKNLQEAGKEAASASANRLDEVVQDTLAAPGHLLEAASIQMKEGFPQLTLKIAQRIQATPGRLVDASIESALQSTLQVAETIKAPGKLVEASMEALMQPALHFADHIKASPGKFTQLKNFLPWGQEKAPKSAHPPTSPPPLHLL
jgi:hypothetical protein